MVAGTREHQVDAAERCDQRGCRCGLVSYTGANVCILVLLCFAIAVLMLLVFPNRLSFTVSMADDSLADLLHLHDRRLRTKRMPLIPAARGIQKPFFFKDHTCGLGIFGSNMTNVRFIHSFAFHPTTIGLPCGPMLSTYSYPQFIAKHTVAPAILVPVLGQTFV